MVRLLAEYDLEQHYIFTHHHVSWPGNNLLPNSLVFHGKADSVWDTELFSHAFSSTVDSAEVVTLLESLAITLTFTLPPLVDVMGNVCEPSNGLNSMFSTCLSGVRDLSAHNHRSLAIFNLPGNSQLVSEALHTKLLCTC